MPVQSSELLWSLYKVQIVIYPTNKPFLQTYYLFVKNMFKYVHISCFCCNNNRQEKRHICTKFCLEMVKEKHIHRMIRTAYSGDSCHLSVDKMLPKLTRISHILVKLLALYTVLDFNKSFLLFKNKVLGATNAFVHFATH